LFFWRKKEPQPAEPAAADAESPDDVPVEAPAEPEEPAWAPPPPAPEPEPEPAWAPATEPEREPAPEPEPDPEPAPEPAPEPEPSWDAAAAAVVDAFAPSPEPERKLSWSERLAGPAIFQPEPSELEEPVAPDLSVRLEKSRGGFMSRLREALVGEGTAGPSWDDVEETLIAGDVGASLALEVVERARSRRDPGGAEVAVRSELAALLAPRNGAWQPRPTAGGPAVILVVGVNGTGKTTTIGKLAARYRVEGHSVILAAADTFRAAAIDQLRIWAERAGAPVVAHAPGADPGAVVYDALDAAVARGADIVIADTAGRLHTKVNLMDELTKIRRIIDKRLPGAEPETLFVLDATTGQNGLAQAKAFHDAVGLTGIVLTKLDSTAKGGIVFAIEESLGVPVRFVGVGEKAGDLVPFDPEAFVAALFA
jgi:fused signal recognition particle receptor